MLCVDIEQKEQAVEVVNYMKIGKALILVGVVILFLGLASAPGISAIKPESRRLTIWMPGITEDDYTFQVVVSQEQLDELNNETYDFMEVAEAARDENSPDGTNITVSEWEGIKTSVTEMINSIKDIVGDDFPEIDTVELIGTVIGLILGPLYYLRQPVFSVGFGAAWLPFYPYESFIGKILRPVFIQYIAGFTGTFHVNPFPPRIPYFSLGLHRVRTLIFNGLFINFGDVMRDKVIGPVMLIGYGFTLMA